jgi:hypothetical protein
VSEEDLELKQNMIKHNLSQNKESSQKKNPEDYKNLVSRNSDEEGDDSDGKMDDDYNDPHANTMKIKSSRKKITSGVVEMGGTQEGRKSLKSLASKGSKLSN